MYPVYYVVLLILYAHYPVALCTCSCTLFVIFSLSFLCYSIYCICVWLYCYNHGWPA